MARYGIPINPNPFGAFVEGVTGGIQSAQDTAARQEQVRAIQAEGRSRRAAEELQQDISQISPSTIRGELPAGQQGPAVPNPAEYLDMKRAIAMANPNKERREDALYQLARLGMQGAVFQTTQARGLMNKNPQAAVDSLNKAFKFVDSNSPDMFSLGADGKTILDWNGQPVTNSIIDSIGLAALKYRDDPLAVSEYLRALATEKFNQDMEAKRVAAIERQAATEEQRTEYWGKNAAASIYADILRSQAILGASGTTTSKLRTQKEYEERVASESERVVAEGEGSLLGPLYTYLPRQQVNSVAAGILGVADMNGDRDVDVGTAMQIAAVITGSSLLNSKFGNKLLPDEHARDAVDTVVGKEGPVFLEFPEGTADGASTQVSPDGTPLFHKVRVSSKDQAGNVLGLTPWAWVPHSLMGAMEAAPPQEPTPGASFADKVEGAKKRSAVSTPEEAIPTEDTRPGAQKRAAASKALHDLYEGMQTIIPEEEKVKNPMAR